MPDISPEPMAPLRSLALRASLASARVPVSASGLRHRDAMRRVKILVPLAVEGRLRTGVNASESPDGAVEVSGLLQRLEDLQSPSGPFLGDDNVLSPPDSAFTINDACDAHHLLAGALRDHPDPAWEEIRGRIEAIIARATRMLVAGGVQTPNHRWEISAALARIHRDFPSPQLVTRVDEWLAEGVDIDDAGHFSERSANYATAVTDPSLIAIASILDRPALLDIVEKNLGATLPLIGSDGTVETVHSRRQDQRMRFSLAPYLLLFRKLALRTGRGDLAWAAQHAQVVAEREGMSPEILSDLLLDPGLEQQLPPALAPGFGATVLMDGVGLAIRRSPKADVVVYAGSDYPQHHRIRSGLANNPTFMRMIAGDAVLDAVRLSRAFFSLGPFRANGVERLSDGRVRLSETIEASYYQPFPRGKCHADGAYTLTDDGRFSASMDFGKRQRDIVRLRTRLTVRLLTDGADLEVHTEGPSVPFSLEFTFRDGGTLDTWPRRAADDPHGALYRCGESAISVVILGLDPVNEPLPYFPGEEYNFLGGTDATEGVKFLVGGLTPGTFRVALRAIASTRPSS